VLFVKWHSSVEAHEPRDAMLKVSGSPGHSIAYKGYWDCVHRMYRRQGLAAFYRGAGVNALRIVPAAAVQFAAYDMLKYALLALDPSAASPL